MSPTAVIYRNEGKHAQAEPLLTEVLEGRRRVLGERHPDTLLKLSQLVHLEKVASARSVTAGQ